MSAAENNSAIIGVGLDLADVARIRKLMDKYADTFLARTFAQVEIDYCLSRADAPLHFAARFAAKEAMAKALGTGFTGDITLKSFWIENDAMGAPLAKLDAAARKRADAMGAGDMKVSLTHLKDYAQAIAILSRK